MRNLLMVLLLGLVATIGCGHDYVDRPAPAVHDTVTVVVHDTVWVKVPCPDDDKDRR